MLSIPPAISIFLYTQPTDMRKGFDGLSGIVRSELAAAPPAGALEPSPEPIATNRTITRSAADEPMVLMGAYNPAAG